MSVTNGILKFHRVKYGSNVCIFFLHFSVGFLECVWWQQHNQKCRHCTIFFSLQRMIRQQRKLLSTFNITVNHQDTCYQIGPINSLLFRMINAQRRIPNMHSVIFNYRLMLVFFLFMFIFFYRRSLKLLQDKRISSVGSPSWFWIQ